MVAEDEEAMSEDALAGDVVATPIKSNCCCYIKLYKSEQIRRNLYTIFWSVSGNV